MSRRTENLAKLILRRAEQSPDHRFGLTDAPLRLADAVQRACEVAGALDVAGLQPGDVVAVLGSNSNEYLVTWFGLQFAGLEPALINPTYPNDLLTTMIEDLRPAAVVRVGAAPDVDLFSDLLQIDTTSLFDGEVSIGSRPVRLGPAAAKLAGLNRKGGDIAGYMHTSGTTGNPKFCAQSHDYFLWLGSFVADSMCLGHRDVVFAPLPLFHINPLGYGVVGALTANAEFFTSSRFSASGFWPEVIATGTTAIVLHEPPVEILKRATTPADATGHQVRVMFYTDTSFLETYDIPVGLSAYGSTEAAGLTHMHVWRKGDTASAVEGASHVAGQVRRDIDWRITDAGELQVRELVPHVMFEAYRIGGALVDPRDADGWFSTGDSARVDGNGELIFIERLADAVRVKGEFVPLAHVEGVLTAVAGIAEVALWKVPNGALGDDLVAYVVGEAVEVSAVQEVVSTLPAFMRPRSLVRLVALPKDGGVGKVRRRELAGAAALEVIEL